ncbi:MAG: hypothetical protein JXB29_07365 [Sedimentisphaerales bacterium]|nr:hypothetical protein [Sedimentisphaerales bacterium]
MERFKKVILWCAVCLFTTSLFGCGKKVDENKPISEVKTEAAGMNVEQLKKTALAYKETIMAKQEDIEKITAKLKDIPVAEAIGAEAKKLKSEIDTINESLSALKERFEIYYNQLKEKGGDISGLQI